MTLRSSAVSFWNIHSHTAIISSHTSSPASRQLLPPPLTRQMPCTLLRNGFFRTLQNQSWQTRWVRQRSSFTTGFRPMSESSSYPFRFHHTNAHSSRISGLHENIPPVLNGAKKRLLIREKKRSKLMFHFSKCFVNITSTPPPSASQTHLLV